MMATQNQPVTNEIASDIDQSNKKAVSKIRPLNATPLFLPNKQIQHHPKAGLNPIVDAAGYLFTIAGRLKNIRSYRQLSKLQKELVQEINQFSDHITSLGVTAEYLIVCRYIMCATLDDIIANTAWGSKGQWEAYSLLAIFNQDPQHQDKFFTILERALQEPNNYIDLMELIYISLSLGYKGQYRSTEHSQYQLDQITNNLYKHIQVYRGHIQKILSPTPQKPFTEESKKKKFPYFSLLYIFLVTTSIIMTIFVSLGYLMDVISNEAYKNLSQIQTTVFNPDSK